MADKVLFVRSKWNPQAKDEEKWPLLNDHYNRNKQKLDWAVRAKDGGTHFLPKSDYVPCKAPEVWERVEVVVDKAEGPCIWIFNRNRKIAIGSATLYSGYRVVSLVVERRKAT